jgi:hypothetical protein
MNVGFEVLYELSTSGRIKGFDQTHGTFPGQQHKKANILTQKWPSKNVQQNAQLLSTGTWSNATLKTNIL